MLTDDNTTCLGHQWSLQLSRAGAMEELLCKLLARPGFSHFARFNDESICITDTALAEWAALQGMFWSGGLSAQDAADIVSYNQNNDRLSRLGVWSGGLNFENRLISFTEQGHGYGLVQHAPAEGFAELFVLQLYSEIAHDCSRGSWTCFETRGLPNWTPAGGYATPAQAVVPLHVRWMLLFEDPIKDTVTLLKTTPRSWLKPGERITIRNAPLGRGRMSFEVQSKLAASTPTVAANISLDHIDPTTVPPLYITLRVPQPWRMMSVLVNGEAWQQFDAPTELIQLPPPNSTLVVVATFYSDAIRKRVEE